MKGVTHEAAATALTFALREEVTLNGVRSCWDDIVQSGWMTGRKEFGGKLRTAHDPSPVEVMHDLKRRSLLHLLDLKRAGHSPTRTEYRIGRDGAPRILAATCQTRSYCGSSAATCAEHA